MTQVEYVASQILEALHLFDNKKDGNYSQYIAKVAIAAVKEFAKLELSNK